MINTTIVLDSKSSRYFDENGYLVIKDNKIAKAGVFDYLGREISDKLPAGELYKVYRPWEELEKTAKDFEGMPVKFGHEWVEPSKRDLKIGSISGEVKAEEPYLTADIKIYDKTAIEAITGEGIVDLSPGYSAKYTAEAGEYNGEEYDFTQRDIKYNHLAVVDNGRSEKDVRIADEHWKGVDSSARSAHSQNDTVDRVGKKNDKDNFNLKGDKDMSKNLKQNALYALSHAKKVYDECITSKTDDVDKRELIREIVAIAVKPDTDFQGGEEEKFRTILKKAESLGYEPSETSKTDDNDMAEPAKKGTDSDIAAMKEAFNSFASLFNDFLSEEQTEGAHATNDDEPVMAKKDDDKKQIGDAAFIDSLVRSAHTQNDKVGGIVSKKTMDAQIQAAILQERKRTEDAAAAYEEVKQYVGAFNMSGMSADNIYQYGYKILSGENIRVEDAKASWKAYMKAKTLDSSFAGHSYNSSADEIFTHIK